MVHVLTDNGVNGHTGAGGCVTTPWTVTTYYFSAGCSSGGGGTTTGTGTDTGTGDNSDPFGNTGQGSGTNDNDSTGGGPTGSNDDVTDPDSQPAEEECLQDSNGNCIEDVGVLIIPDDNLEDPNDPCNNSGEVINKLNALVNTNAQVNDKVVELKNYINTNPTQEKGYSFVENSDLTFDIFLADVNANATTKFRDPPRQNCKLRIHAHTKNEFPVPSWQDTWVQFPHFYEATNDTDVIDIVVTENSLYAFVVNDTTQLSFIESKTYVETNPDDTPINPNSDAVKMQNYIKQQEDRFYKPLENKLQLGLITPEDADIESEKLFINLTKQLNNLHAFGPYKAQKIGDHYVWECLDVKPKSN